MHRILDIRMDAVAAWYNASRHGARRPAGNRNGVLTHTLALAEWSYQQSSMRGHARRLLPTR